jgi:enoyl-CoA hydratase/carnithine racemase
MDEIIYEVADPVATITLNRPERLNAMTNRMFADFRRAVEAAAEDPAVVGIVVTGVGRAFSAGLDTDALSAIAEAGTADSGASSTGRGGLFSYLTEVPKPVIAAVNGVTAGGGYVLATMCDVRFASPAARFTTVFSKRGLVGEHGVTWTTPRLVVWDHAGLDIDTSLEDVVDVVGAQFGRPDVAEGVNSFLEKRPPAFPRLGSPEAHPPHAGRGAGGRPAGGGNTAAGTKSNR